MADEAKSAPPPEDSVGEAQRGAPRSPRMTIKIYQVGPNGSRHVRTVTSNACESWGLI